MRDFKLSQKFLEQFSGRQPDWGFGALSYATYKRTYARRICNDCGSYNVDKQCEECKSENIRTEEFWETIRRVVEGTFTIQKRHCQQHKLYWDNKKAQRSAQTMFLKMWEFKFLPPGRGLWMMGTDAIDIKGGGGLNNPLGLDTLILTEEHGWIKIGDITSDKVRVLSSTKLYGRDNSTNHNSIWVDAYVSQVEEHPCIEIEYEDKFGKNTKIISSENHRWFRRRIKSNWERVDATELKVGDYLPIIKPSKRYTISDTGCAHGFFFGDGTRSNGELHQFGKDNISILQKLFNKVDFIANNHAVVRHLPLAWGHIPEDNYLSDNKYLYGFLAGYFAADGHVNKNGTAILTSARLDELQTVQQLFEKLGIRTKDIRVHSTKSNLVDNRNTLYGLQIETIDLDEQFFLKQIHLDRYLQNRCERKRDWLKIKSIKSVGVRQVRCVTVPQYEQFVVEGFALTSNCGFTSTENLEIDFSGPFCWAMDFLMLGVGVGFDTKGDGAIIIQEPAPRPEGYVFVIPDTREGWIEALKLTLEAFASGKPIPKYDYSQIREKGAPIKTFGGTSSGPDPLRSLLETVRALLTIRIDSPIKELDIVDIMNYIGKAVVAGNVRRSAEIACGNPNSVDFIQAKDPSINSEALNDRRWASNNSILAQVGMDYTQASKFTAKNGEPGYIWLENAKMFGRMKDAPNNKDYRIGGFNPCAEQGLEDKELCNLVETFPANHSSAEEFHDTLKYAFMYAKTVTLIMSHDPRTNSVMIRNRRIGTSMSGIEQAKKKFGIYNFYKYFCDDGYEVIKKYDRIYSEWLGIALSIKLTTVKPSGTVSLLAGATPGVHAAHSEFYYRTMRLAHDSPLVQALLNAGYRIELGTTEWKLEYEQDGPTKEEWPTFVVDHPVQKKIPDWFSGTVVAYFPVKEKNFTKGKKDQTIWEQAENAAKMQYYWSDNSVSVTINMFEEEKHLVPTILEHYQTRMKTISFLPFEHGYSQAPYQELSEEEYKAAIKNLKPIEGIETIGREIIDGYCESDRCEIRLPDAS